MSENNNTCCETPQPQGVSTASNFEREAEAHRQVIKSVARDVRRFKDLVQNMDCLVQEDRGEELANITLAYRHLEDAAMRIGKAMQAYHGGTSILDKMSMDEKTKVARR